MILTNLEKQKMTAKLFKLAAKRCLEERTLPNKRTEMLAQPAVINIAFSLELYIKYLIECQEKNCEDEHKLDILFDILNENSKKYIINNSGLSENEFYKNLRENSNLFDEWRYIFDKDNNYSIVQIEFLNSVIESIEKYINHM